MYHASVGITTNMKVKATRWIAENADSLGVHSIWIGEDIGIGQDPFILSAASLMHSHKVRVGTGIIPITTHHISTLARAVMSLYEIGSNRFIFGTGIGGIQDLERLKIQIQKPVTTLRETVTTLRRLWAGDDVTITTDLFKLDSFGLHMDGPRHIPVFLGVRGPQMLRLVGEIADGAILSGPLDYLKYAVAEIDKAAVKASREPADIEKVAWLPTIPTFKGGKEDLAKKVVSVVVADMPLQVVEMLSIDHEKVFQLKEAVSKGGPDAGISLVDDEMLDTFSIAGDLHHMVDMFEKVANLGITEIVLGPPFSGDWREAMTDIFQEIAARRDQR